MPSKHFTLCRPLRLLASIFPSTSVFSSESALRIKWPKDWSFSCSINPSSEYSGLISFRIDWFNLAVSEAYMKLMWLKIALWECVKAPLPKLLEPDKLWNSEFSIWTYGIWTYILEPLSGFWGVPWTQSQYFYIKIRKIYIKWDKVNKKPHFRTADKGLHPREIKQLAQDHSLGCEPQRLMPKPLL